MGLRTLTIHNTALVVIDIQDKLLKLMDTGITEQVIRNVNLLTRMFNRWSAPVILTEHYVKGLGLTCTKIKEHLPSVTPIEKTIFSCYAVEPFIQAIAASQCANIVLTGMEAHICVLQTALDLLAKDYAVYVMVDGVQSSTQLRWQYGLKLMEQAGAVLAPTETLLFQLLGRADSDDFKYFLKLLKEG